MTNREKFIKDWSKQIAYWANEEPDASLELIVSRIMDSALQYKDKLDEGFIEDYKL